VLAGVRSGEAPAGTEAVQLDVTNEDDVRALAEIDPLDALVNNAGIAVAAPLEFLPPEELRTQLEVNVIGQVAVTQAVLPALRAARGRIVFVGSVSGRSALPFMGPYAASKHALEAVADSLRVELAPWGIGVTIVEPGTIRTPMWARGGQRAEELSQRAGERAAELYGARAAAFRRIAAERGANGAPAEAVAAVVARALTAKRAPARVLVGRDAHIRAAIERFPDRLRDRAFRKLLLRE
jgi:NAD(P)-dependent dehydrogenase (short-subunit alcohol dehydrogenase family)